eukprot:5439663-Amphidinium_carterae.1
MGKTGSVEAGLQLSYLKREVSASASALGLSFTDLHHHTTQLIVTDHRRAISNIHRERQP